MTLIMDLHFKVRLRKNFESICQDLDVFDIHSQLVTKCVFDPDELETICCEPVRHKRTNKLLTQLLHLTEKEYVQFRDCLVANFPWLVSQLDQTEVTYDEIQYEKDLLSSTLPSLPPHYIQRAETDEIIQHILSNACHVVSLTGPGGNGKTSAAISLANTLINQNYKVIYFCARNVHAADFITTSLLYILDAEPPSKSHLDDVNFLCIILQRQKSRLLVILDNIDDVLTTTQGGNLGNLLAKISRISNVKCLVTSRVKLTSIGSTSIFHKEIPALSDAESTSLLKKLKPDIDPLDVVRLVKACGGSPLAIRLTASLVNYGLGADDIITDIEATLLKTTSEALGCLMEQDRLQSCISTSYEQLDDKQKKFFIQLSIFGNTFDVNAAEAVTGNSKAATKLLLITLQNRSLCLYDQHTKRFVLHQLLKTFGMQQLHKSGLKTETKKRFTAHFVASILKLSDQYYSKNSTTAIADFALDQINIEDTLHFLTENEHQETEQFKHLGSRHILTFLSKMLGLKVMKPFCENMAACSLANLKYKLQYQAFLASVEMNTGNVQNALWYLSPLQESDGINFISQPDVISNAEFEYYSTWYVLATLRNGEREKAIKMLPSISIPNADDKMPLGELRMIIFSHDILGTIHNDLGNHKAVLKERTLAKTIMEQFMQLGAHHDKINLIHKYATVCIDTGSIDEATSLLNDLMAMCTDCSWCMSYDMVQILTSFAKCLMQKGEYEEAKQKCTEGLKIIGEIGLQRSVVHRRLLLTLAQVLYNQSNFMDAAKAFDEVVGISKENGEPYNVALGLYWQGLVLQKLGKLKKATEAFEEALCIYTQINDTHKMVLLCQELSALHFDLGNESTAIQYEEKSKTFLMQ